MEDRLLMNENGGSKVRLVLCKRLIPALLLMMMLVPAANASASAGDGPRAAGRQPEADPLVRCQPTSVSVPVGQQAVVDIYVQDVTNLYGADVMVSFNPVIGAVVDQIAFQPGVQILPLYTWMTPGFFTANGVYGPAANPPNCGVDCIWYAFTQLNPTPPVSGSGPIGRITFLGLQAGTFQMNWINNQLSAPGGVPIQPVNNQPCTVTFTDPLAVTLAAFDATAQPDHVLVSWETVSETGNAGFNLYRSEAPDDPGQMLNAALIPAQNPGATSGAAYSWQDFSVQPDHRYYYWLEDVTLAGAATMHGPVSVDFAAPTAVTLGSVQASPAAGAGALPTLWIVAGAGAALALGRRR
jgi:hypothetical protein